jgi:hypothetical protein
MLSIKGGEAIGLLKQTLDGDRFTAVTARAGPGLLTPPN